MSQHNVAQERKEIVARYDKGREEGAVIDPWEDPQYEVYHKTDRYGFIHDKRLPPPGNDNKKILDTEMRRVGKWLKMVDKWDENVNSPTFRERVYKGIPDKVRSLVWKKLLKIDEIKELQQNVYKNMREQARNYSPEIRQIDLDVNRTYRNHDMFRQRYGIKQKELFHVLGAYSMYNTEVGYCQGMSQIAALLLMYMNDEDAFWGLSVLLSDRKYAMHGFFIPGFPKLMRFQTQHDAILKKFLPKIKKHVDKHDVHTNIYSVKWFFQCFLDRVPFHLCLRLWDIYLLDGERVLIAMAYNVFKMHRQSILKLKSMEAVIDLLQRELEHDFGHPDDDVIKNLQECMDELRRSKLDLSAPPDDELPTKPFGLLYNPTVGQVRRIVDSTSSTGRTSSQNTEEREKDREKAQVPNGHPASPPMIMSGLDVRPLASERSSRTPSASERNSRPSSRQLTHTPSIYDNVDHGTAGKGNRIRPLSPTAKNGPIEPVSPASAGDQRYVSYVQVTSDGRDKVTPYPHQVLETSEVYTREFNYQPVRGPEAARRVSAHHLVKRESLKEPGSPNRAGATREIEMTIPSKPRGRESINGGPTVIRIG